MIYDRKERYIETSSAFLYTHSTTIYDRSARHNAIKVLGIEAGVWKLQDVKLDNMNAIVDILDCSLKFYVHCVLVWRCSPVWNCTWNVNHSCHSSSLSPSSSQAKLKLSIRRAFYQCFNTLTGSRYLLSRHVHRRAFLGPPAPTPRGSGWNLWKRIFRAARTKLSKMCRREEDLEETVPGTSGKWFIPQQHHFEELWRLPSWLLRFCKFSLANEKRGCQDFARFVWIFISTKLTATRHSFHSAQDSTSLRHTYSKWHQQEQSQPKR